MFSSTEGQKRAALGVLRIGIAIVFIMHGYQKLFIMGHEGVTGFFTSLHIPMPAVAAWLVSLLEFGGGIMLLIGALVRPIALMLAIDMLVAINTVHWQNGFFAGQKPGYEFVGTLMVGAIALVIGGSGSWSVDDEIRRRRA